MINRFIILSVFLVCCFGAHAQSGYYVEGPKAFSGGLVAGANFTQVDGDTFYGYDKVGLNAGGIVYIRFTETFGASMELDYTQKGSRGELVTGSQALGAYVQKYFMNLNYVEVPIALHFKIEYKSHPVYFEGGLSYAYLVKSSEYVLSDPPVTINPALNSFNTTDFDYILGIAVKIYKKLYLNGRFQYSIVDMRPSNRVPVGFGYGNSGQFNNMFNLRFMYLF